MFYDALAIYCSNTDKLCYLIEQPQKYADEFTLFFKSIDNIDAYS
jgi:hypothetical protein